ncbi:hypothetical protein [Halobacillus massiliensis]|uniref:hypothetical protein n=1 Tax=Halobacillus massiliensis TaxID=1926286 RepID=UPI0009E20071|nr:hypothetical protein [Halobacillus massiliensis]
MWFSRRNKNRDEKTDKDEKSEIENLKQQISLLQQVLEAKKQPVEYHFHIDHVDIHHPKLEELTFQLDQIDIEDLSGALNVGNNFGVTIGSKKKKEIEESDKHGPKTKTTKDGYSFSFNQKEG